MLVGGLGSLGDILLFIEFIRAQYKVKNLKKNPKSAINKLAPKTHIFSQPHSSLQSSNPK